MYMTLTFTPQTRCILNLCLGACRPTYKSPVLFHNPVRYYCPQASLFICNCCVTVATFAILASNAVVDEGVGPRVTMSKA